MVKPTTGETSSPSPPSSPPPPPPPPASSGGALSEKSEPKYRGVRKRKWGKWVSEIRLRNSRERIWLGSYETAEKAARAFDAALYCLHGNKARFNFPEKPPEIPGAMSLSPQQIQVVASRYANEQEIMPRAAATSSSSADLKNSPPVNLQSQMREQQEEEQCTSTTTTTTTTETFSTLPESDRGVGVVESDDMNIDWSFLNLLDSDEHEGRSHFGLYSGLDSDMCCGDFCPPPPATTTTTIANMDEDNVDDQHISSLWNF